MIPQRATLRTRQRRTLISATIGEGAARLKLSWFNAPYLYERLHVGEEILVSGELSLYGGAVQMTNPEFDDGERSELADGRLRARYPLAAGLKQGHLRKLVDQVLENGLEEVEEQLSTLRSAA